VNVKLGNEDLKEVMNIWGDSLKEYGLLIEFDPNCSIRSELLETNRVKISFEVSERDRAKQLSSQILMYIYTFLFLKNLK
jgi:hypothetical protein